jgi:hypothetical protein
MHVNGDTVERADVNVRRIRRVLAQRHAIHIGELSMILGLPYHALRTYLDGLAAAGEVERLRPVSCGTDDHDFYRLTGTHIVPTLATPSGRDNACVRLAGEAMACALI